YGFRPSERRSLRQVVGGSIFGDVRILTGKEMRYLAPRVFAFLDSLTGPEGNEVVWIGDKIELFAFDERFLEIYGVFSNADVRQQISMPNVMFDDGDFVTGRQPIPAMPTLFDVRRSNRQHISFPGAGREPHPRMRCVLGRVRAAVHPDRPALLVRVDVLVDSNELMRDLIAFFPYPHLQRPTVNVFHDVHLTLMFGKPEPRRGVGKCPLASVIVNRKTNVFNEGRSG